MLFVAIYMMIYLYVQLLNKGHCFILNTLQKTFIDLSVKSNIFVMKANIIL